MENTALRRSIRALARLFAGAYFTALVLLVATAAEAASTQVRVSAVVAPRARLTDVQQVAIVKVTAEDVQRGFVEVPGATRFELFSNAPAHFALEASGNWFRRVQMSGLPGADLELASSSSAVAMLPAFLQRFRGELSVRFHLSQDARPGTYSWPLRMSVTPV